MLLDGGLSGGILITQTHGNNIQGGNMEYYIILQDGEYKMISAEDGNVPDDAEGPYSEIRAFFVMIFYRLKQLGE